MHQIVKNTYSWRQVAQRTERVYNFAMQQPALNSYQRIKSGLSWGPIVGVYGVLYQMMEYLVLFLLEWL